MSAGFWHPLCAQSQPLRTAVLLSQGTPNTGDYLSVCFLMPSDMVFALSFISPSIVHHILLGMTLYKSYTFYREQRAIEGPGLAVLPIIKRDQSLWVLAICLTGFSNVVLVVQHSTFPYKLVSDLYHLMISM